MLVTYVIHTEQQSRYQRNNHNRHDALAINCVMYVRSRFRSLVGHEQECFEAVKHRLECVELQRIVRAGLDMLRSEMA